MAQVRQFHSFLIPQPFQNAPVLRSHIPADNILHEPNFLTPVLQSMQLSNDLIPFVNQIGPDRFRQIKNPRPVRIRDF